MVSVMTLYGLPRAINGLFSSEEFVFDRDKDTFFRNGYSYAKLSDVKEVEAQIKISNCKTHYRAILLIRTGERILIAVTPREATYRDVRENVRAVSNITGWEPADCAMKSQCPDLIEMCQVQNAIADYVFAASVK